MLRPWWGRNALLIIVNGTLPSILVGNFLRNAKSGELGFVGNISTLDTIALDITVSDSCSISLSMCVNVSVQVQSSNVTCPHFDPSVFNVTCTISENTPSQTMVLNGAFLQGGFSNTSGATISFVLCANTMYGNNLALNKPVGTLCCPLEGKEPQLTSSPFQALLESVKMPLLKL